LGNLNAERDWGHAKDYVYMQWLMLQADEAKDYVIASGSKYSVRDFIEAALNCVGVKIEWSGVGVNEIGKISDIFDDSYLNSLGLDCKNLIGNTIIKIDPYYFRPTEVDLLHGDPSKAVEELNWKPKISFHDLVKEMMLSDLAG